MRIIDHPLARKRFWIPILLLVLSQLLAAFFGFYTTMKSSHLIRFVFELLISVAIWYLADLLIDRVKVHGWFKYSFSIYVWHPFIITYMQSFVKLMGITELGGAAYLICFIIFGISASVLLILLFRFMERNMKSTYRLLTGGR